MNCFFYICPIKNDNGLLLRKNISTLTDEELLARFRKTGDNEYFGELYNRYIPLIYGVCLKYLRDADRAQDAVMQLFEDLLPKVGNYEIGVFRTWLHTVVRNHCYQIFRRETKEISIDYEASLMESDEILHLLMEDDEEAGRMAALKHCLEKLPEAQRTSILYFFYEEMSYADIADKTGFAPGKVKSYIQNGKRNLKICMEK